jgi:hypothetical protein
MKQQLRKLYWINPHERLTEEISKHLTANDEPAKKQVVINLKEHDFTELRQIWNNFLQNHSCSLHTLEIETLGRLMISNVKLNSSRITLGYYDPHRSNLINLMKLRVKTHWKTPLILLDSDLIYLPMFNRFNYVDYQIEDVYAEQELVTFDDRDYTSLVPNCQLFLVAELTDPIIDITLYNPTREQLIHLDNYVFPFNATHNRFDVDEETKERSTRKYVNLQFTAPTIHKSHYEIFLSRYSALRDVYNAEIFFNFRLRELNSDSFIEFLRRLNEHRTRATFHFAIDYFVCYNEGARNEINDIVRRIQRHAKLTWTAISESLEDDQLTFD